MLQKLKRHLRNPCPIIFSFHPKAYSSLPVYPPNKRRQVPCVRPWLNGISFTATRLRILNPFKLTQTPLISNVRSIKHTVRYVLKETLLSLEAFQTSEPSALTTPLITILSVLCRNTVIITW